MKISTFLISILLLTIISCKDERINSAEKLGYLIDQVIREENKTSEKRLNENMIEYTKFSFYELNQSIQSSKDLNDSSSESQSIKRKLIIDWDGLFESVIDTLPFDLSTRKSFIFNSTSIFELKKLIKGDPKFLLIDSSRFKNNDDEYVAVYYNEDQNYIVLIGPYSKYPNGDYLLKELYFENLSDSCNLYNQKEYFPYQYPSDIFFVWDKSYDGMKFLYGKLKFANTTNADIDFIKFQIKLSFREKEVEHTFFSRTMEYNQKIFKNDIIEIPIPPVQGLRPGIDLNREQFNFEVIFLDVRPKPQTYWCRELEMLKKSTSSKMNS